MHNTAYKSLKDIPWVSYAQRRICNVPNLQRTSYSQAPPCLHQNYTDTRKSLEMSDKLFEALRSVQDNTNKIISFVKLIDMNNLI